MELKNAPVLARTIVEARKYNLLRPLMNGSFSEVFAR
jgi:hypothetical protein